MSRPSVNIGLSNGQLGIVAPSEFGTSVVLIAAPVAPASGYGVVKLIKTKADAATEFGQVGNEEVLKAIVSGFYAEAPEGTKLYAMCMAQATTLQTLAAAANAEKPLNAANSQARLVAFIKFPSGSYTPTVTNGFDADVHLAVTDAQTLANTWFGIKKPFRYFVEGYACSGVAADAKDYSTTQNRNGHIVAASVGDSTALATMLALGRAAGSQPQRNIGRIKSGSLNIADADTIAIGATDIDEVTSTTLDVYNDKRYITIERNLIASGYVFTDDNSLVAATDDYNNLRNGRVMDNVTRVAFSTYYKELKEDVDVDENTGRLSISIEKGLEAAIVNDINVQMGGQLSTKKDGTASVKSFANPDPAQYAALYAAANIANPNLNILQAGTVYLFVEATPKGCLKTLNIFLGFVI